MFTKTTVTFWSTQPVMIRNEMECIVFKEPGMIDQNIPVRHEPYTLHEQFEWADAIPVQEMHDLISLHYVQDDHLQFRYSVEFLQWATHIQGKRSWHVGVRVKATQKLVAFISAIPATVQLFNKTYSIVEVAFLCIHQRLRNKRLAPLLIKEIARRVNADNDANVAGVQDRITMAMYTTATLVHTPIATCRYYHWPLHYKKLVQVGFMPHPTRVGSWKPDETAMSKMIKKYTLPLTPRLPGTRRMENRDIAAVQALLTAFLSARCDVFPQFTVSDIQHWLLPSTVDTVYSYVVEDPSTGNVTDFYSFYSLPFTVLNRLDNNSIVGTATTVGTTDCLRVAYLFYYAPRSSDRNSTIAVIRDALIQAKAAGFDVLNCLDIMGNDVFLNDLAFVKGTGTLHYYLANYQCGPVDPSRIGVLLF